MHSCSKRKDVHETKYEIIESKHFLPYCNITFDMEKSELLMLFAALVLFIYFDSKLQNLERRLLQLQLSGRYVSPVGAPALIAPPQQQITEKMAESIVPSVQEQKEQVQQGFTWGPYDGSGFAPVW